MPQTRRFPFPRFRLGLRRLGRRDHGNVAIEYALLAAIVGLGLISALKSTKQSLNSNYDKITYEIGKAVVDPVKGQKTVASTYTDGQTVNGVYNYRNWTLYSDGSKSMVQTNNNNAAAGWQTALFEYDGNGNTTGLHVTNPDGSFQYDETFEIIRPGVSVNTITDASGKPYAFQETTIWEGLVATQTRVMTMTSGRTDLWQRQVVTSDYRDDKNIRVSAVCIYGGTTVAC